MNLKIQFKSFLLSQFHKFTKRYAAAQREIFFLIESDQFCFTTLECMSVILMWQLFKKLIDSFIECEYDRITHWD